MRAYSSKKSILHQRHPDEFTFPHFISLAAYHQHLAFTLKSEAARTRNAKLAEFWYQRAADERALMLIAAYDPKIPYHKSGIKLGG